MRELARVLNAAPAEGSPMTARPCRIVTATPLVIDFYDTATYSASKVTGLTYTNGAHGVAVFPGSGVKPFVLPTT